METAVLQEEKTKRLFTYLKELSSLKSPLVRDINQYENYIFLNEIPNEPECVSPLFSELKDTWVEIKKPNKPLYPHPSEDLNAWLAPSYKPEDIETEPKLLEKIPNPEFNEAETDEEDSTSPYLFIQDLPEINLAFNTYINDEWIPWKHEFSRYEDIQQIYTKHFSLYQKHKKLGEQFELLIGIGLLNWRTPENQLVHRHVLTVPCQFQFDSSNGIIRVLPSAGDSKAEFEQDMLELESRLDNQSLFPIKEKLEELQGNIWNKPLLDSLFKSIVFSLSANGTYHSEEYSNKKEAAKEPDITYSPVLILRKRTEKGFQQACSTIIENAEKGGVDIPQGILRIFEEIDDFQHSNSGQADPTNLLPNEENKIFFPLDSNDEQRKIITNLVTRNGVLVQGPPGTGKSHTIANLTSHLLASGKKVLITSETPRALRVLKDKIPKELQALCVSLLGGDSKSFKDLESVVQVISNKRDTWDKESTSALISELTAKLRKDQEKQAQLKHQLRSLREKETYEHHFMNGLYTGTAQKIAATLAEERPQYHWLADNIDMDAANPLTNNDAAELLELLQELNEEIQHDLQFSVPPADLLFSHAEFQNKVLHEEDLLNKKVIYQELNKEITTQLTTISPERRSDLTSLLNELGQTYRILSYKSQIWLTSSLEDLIQGKFTPWEEFFNQISTNIDTIGETANKHNLTEISGAGQVTLSQLHSDAKLLRTHFESGKGLGMPLLRAKVVKDAWYIVKDVRIDGRKCDTLESLILLEETVNIDHSLKKMEQMIMDQLKIELGSTHSRAIRVAAIKDILELFSGLFSAKQLISKIKKDFNDVPVIHQLTLHENTITELTLQLEYITLTEKLAKINVDLLKIIENIHQSINSKVAHPIVNDLISSIKNRQVDNYRKFSKRVQELDVYSQKGKRSEELLQKLKTILPRLYANLISNFDYERWAERFMGFEKAFAWAKVNTWYTQFSLTSEGKLKKDLNDLEKSIKETITRLGAQKAWFSTLDSMSEGQRQHLLAWTTSMRKVGKGTGKNAYIHLQDAQKHMAECREAIPAWIMPLYRVFETFEVRPNLFDVVIIDEASQSGPDAIILQYIAKKLIVVGDDKQISPEYIGIKREDIQFLRNQYLFDFKLADMLDIENSFFDLANVLFGGRITLREHFRCMPEIIQFSNRISYTHTPLIPLRQYPPNRLTPVQTRHITTGYREGAGSKVFNRPEAEAIVAEIQSCIANPMYKDKTIGVISLQTEGQAQLIEKLLIEQIGPEEMEKRHLICGDAYAFQGDERDIMFLSLVAAPGQTAMRALTTEKDKRRFNVAVSRARDQLWLFHTPTINDIRNKECLRYQLISYCENPEKEILESNRALCESEFEIAVYDQITSRGYRVIPQFQVAGYRIDLVVEGSKGRIAVECDGDQWHGPDRFDYDMNRQRILERSGWKFWRVRGSDYYYDSEKALTSLWETLDYYDIIPEGIESKTNDPIVRDVQISSDPIKIAVERISPITGPEKEFDPENDIEQAFWEAAVGIEEINQDNSLALSEIHVTTSKASTGTSEIENTDKTDSPSPIVDLNLYLINKGYEVVDKRDKGGALWLIGGQDLTPFISELKQEQIHFTFSYNGSKSTAKRPAWFTTYQN